MNPWILAQEPIRLVTSDAPAPIQPPGAAEPTNPASLLWLVGAFLVLLSGVVAFVWAREADIRKRPLEHAFARACRLLDIPRDARRALRRLGERSGVAPVALLVSERAFANALTASDPPPRERSRLLHLAGELGMTIAAAPHAHAPRGEPSAATGWLARLGSLVPARRPPHAPK